jgi:hypothetical protein
VAHTLLYFTFDLFALALIVHGAIAGGLTKTFFNLAFDLLCFALQFAFLTH